MRPYYYRKFANNESLKEQVRKWLEENWPILLAALGGGVGGGAIGYFVGPKGRKTVSTAIGAAAGTGLGAGLAALIKYWSKKDLSPPPPKLEPSPEEVAENIRRDLARQVAIRNAIDQAVVDYILHDRFAREIEAKSVREADASIRSRPPLSAVPWPASKPTTTTQWDNPWALRDILMTPPSGSSNLVYPD